MKVYWLKENTVLPPDVYGGSLVIGNLDGVHKGHLLLINRAKELARENRIPFNILTFYPHPYLLFYPEKKSFALTPLRSKLRIFKDLGVDNVFLCKFTPRIAALSPQDYVDLFFRNIVRPTYIVVGDDHSFGKNRRGNAAFLRSVGYRVEVIERDLRYSSSYIRELVEDGEMRTAYMCMGRYYEIEDFVHHGEGIAAKLGFPTANLNIRNYVKPRFGVYASRTLINEQWKNGICYYGRRPTLINSEPVLENHIFDVDCDLYGKRIRMIFVDYIRNEIRFNSAEEIKRQLKKDVIDAKGLL